MLVSTFFMTSIADSNNSSNSCSLNWADIPQKSSCILSRHPWAWKVGPGNQEVRCLYHLFNLTGGFV
jgi:hypothetical protein